MCRAPRMVLWSYGQRLRLNLWSVFQVLTALYRLNSLFDSYICNYQTWYSGWSWRIDVPVMLVKVQGQSAIFHQLFNILGIMIWFRLTVTKLSTVVATEEQMYSLEFQAMGLNVKNQHIVFTPSDVCSVYLYLILSKEVAPGE